MEIQLKRYAQAKKALESGLALLPGDGEMLRLVRAIEFGQ
jgi:hypothetical protein